MKFVCRIILFSLLILGTSTTVVTESSQNLIRTFFIDLSVFFVLWIILSL